MSFKGFLEGQAGQIATLQKISGKMDDAKIIFSWSIFSDIFCKVIFLTLQKAFKTHDQRF